MSIPYPANWIAKKPLQQGATIDTAVANCGDWLPNSNCNSNSLFNMPSNTPRYWSGVSGLSELNPSGFDFVGGTGHADTAMTSINTKKYSTVSTPSLGTIYQTNRNENNCNCNSGFGAGQYNCYNNCNCNCACACACDCSACSDCGK